MDQNDSDKLEQGPVEPPVSSPVEPAEGGPVMDTNEADTSSDFDLETAIRKLPPEISIPAVLVGDEELARPEPVTDSPEIDLSIPEDGATVVEDETQPPSEPSATEPEPVIPVEPSAEPVPTNRQESDLAQALHTICVKWAKYVEMTPEKRLEEILKVIAANNEIIPRGDVNPAEPITSRAEYNLSPEQELSVEFIDGILQRSADLHRDRFANERLANFFNKSRTRWSNFRIGGMRGKKIVQQVTENIGVTGSLAVVGLSLAKAWSSAPPLVRNVLGLFSGFFLGQSLSYYIMNHGELVSPDTKTWFLGDLTRRGISDTANLVSNGAKRIWGGISRIGKGFQNLTSSRQGEVDYVEEMPQFSVNEEDPSADRPSLSTRLRNGWKGLVRIADPVGYIIRIWQETEKKRCLTVDDIEGFEQTQLEQMTAVLQYRFDRRTLAGQEIKDNDPELVLLEAALTRLAEGLTSEETASATAEPSEDNQTPKLHERVIDQYDRARRGHAIKVAGSTAIGVGMGLLMGGLGLFAGHKEAAAHTGAPAGTSADGHPAGPEAAAPAAALTGSHGSAPTEIQVEMMPVSEHLHATANDLFHLSSDHPTESLAHGLNVHSAYTDHLTRGGIAEYLGIGHYDSHGHFIWNQGYDTDVRGAELAKFGVGIDHSGQLDFTHLNPDQLKAALEYLHQPAAADHLQVLHLRHEVVESVAHRAGVDPGIVRAAWYDHQHPELERLLDHQFGLAQRIIDHQITSSDLAYLHVDPKSLFDHPVELARKVLTADFDHRELLLSPTGHHLDTAWQQSLGLDVEKVTAAPVQPTGLFSGAAAPEAARQAVANNDLVHEGAFRHIFHPATHSQKIEIATAYQPKPDELGYEKWYGHLKQNPADPMPTSDYVHPAALEAQTAADPHQSDLASAGHQAAHNSVPTGERPTAPSDSLPETVKSISPLGKGENGAGGLESIGGQHPVAPVNNPVSVGGVAEGIVGQDKLDPNLILAQ